MVTQTLQTNRLPDDFANWIGRLIETRGSVVDALFDRAAMPDILAQLELSDEANRRGVNVQVVQRRGDGIVRGIAASPIESLPRGSTVLNSGQHAHTPFNAADFEQTVQLLAGRARATDGQAKMLETGIKAIDIMCPLVAGGTLAIAGDLGAGITVVMEELVRRLSGGSDPLSIFIMMPPPSPEWPYSLEPGFSHAEELRKEGFSEGTVGAVQTFFLRADEGLWMIRRLAALAPVDVVIRLSREHARAKVYPTVDVLASRSCLLETKSVETEHAAIAARARQALAALWARSGTSKPPDDPLQLERALKVQNYFTQPFFCAEPYTQRSGAMVSAVEAVCTCREILDGQHDDVPVEAFYFSGDMTEIRSNTGRTLRFGPVHSDLWRMLCGRTAVGRGPARATSCRNHNPPLGARARIRLACGLTRYRSPDDTCKIGHILRAKAVKSFCLINSNTIVLQLHYVLIVQGSEAHDRRSPHLLGESVFERV